LKNENLSSNNREGVKDQEPGTYKKVSWLHRAYSVGRDPVWAFSFTSSIDRDFIFAHWLGRVPFKRFPFPFKSLQ